MSREEFAHDKVVHDHGGGVTCRQGDMLKLRPNGSVETDTDGLSSEGRRTEIGENPNAPTLPTMFSAPPVFQE